MSRTGGAQQLRAAADLVSAAAAAVTADGRPVLHVRSVFLRDDETCFHLLEADTSAVVAEVLEQAGIEFERLVEAETLR